MPEREPHPWNDETEEELFPIEKNVPIENFNNHPGQSMATRNIAKAMPFEHLSIGESFFVPFSVGLDRQAITNICRLRGEKYNRTFSWRTDKLSGGWRIWRVATPSEKRLLEENGEPK